MPFFCAVPPALPPNREGVRAFPGAGPYSSRDYRPGPRVVIRRNRYYGGARATPRRRLRRRPHAPTPRRGPRPNRGRQGRLGLRDRPASHLRARPRARSSSTALNQLAVLPQARASRWRCSSSTRRGRSSRTTPSCAGRSTSRSTGTRSAASRRRLGLTDQYLPPLVPGFRDGTIYPLERRPGAREGARGGQPARRQGGPLHARLPPVRSRRPGRRSNSSRRSGSRSRSGRRRVRHAVGVPRPARQPGRALGPRARHLDAGLRRPVGYINRLLDAQDGGGTEPGRLRRSALRRADAARGAAARARTRSGLRRPRPAARARCRAARCRSTSSTRRPSSRRVDRLHAAAARARAHDRLPEALGRLHGHPDEPVGDGDARRRVARPRSSLRPRLVAGSMRETVPSPAFATQTAPAPTATATGSSPTGI